MRFIEILNESTVTYVRDLFPYWEITGPGFEAMSPFGEIKAFLTYHAANKWRMEQVKEAYEFLK